MQGKRQSGIESQEVSAGGIVMGKSFVLKDASGRPQGYLMQSGGRIRCRMDAASDAEVTLLFENGVSDAYSVKAHAPEQNWIHSGSQLTGGYVLEAGSLTLATDDQARRCAALRLHAPVQHKERPRDAAVQQAAPPEKKAAAPEKQEHRSFPHRRWPPPPCMPKAVYIRGQWIQSE